MTNIVLLNQAIDKSGLRRPFIAEKIGLTYAGLWKKLNGKSDFTVSEMQKISKVLRLDYDESRKIFFA